MCEQCMAKTLQVGEICRGFCLVKATQDGFEMKKGDYGIVRCNDPDIIFPESLKPFPDPSFEKEDDDSELSMKFVDLVVEFGKYLVGNLAFGHEFYTSCMESGYDPDKHGHVDWWVVHKIGKLIYEFDKYMEGFKNRHSIGKLKKISEVNKSTIMETDLNSQYLVAEYYEKLSKNIFEADEELHKEYLKANSDGTISEFFNLINYIIKESEHNEASKVTT